MEWVYFLIGALVSAPLAAGVTAWRARRALAGARRIAARARTKEHLAELAGLTGGLAHEIKNPLSTVKLNLKLLGEEFAAADDPLVRRHYNRLLRVQEQVQRLHDILEDFLTHMGTPELHKAPLDLRGLLEELIDFFRPQAERSRVVIRSFLPAAAVPCLGDAGLLKQAILNLMINAIQAMSAGGELLLRLSTGQDRAVLEVIDTGPGIAPEARQRIFDAYYTTRPGGSGLGLPTTRRIIRQHDGDVTLDSELGKGTRFVITLPLAQP